MHIETAELARRFMKAVAVAIVIMLCTAISIPVSRADTVASLLGNFTINQFCGIQLDGRVARIHVAVVYGQLPALSELHRADTDGDGVTSQAERDAYVAQLAPGLARGLHLTVDGEDLPLQLQSSGSSLPTEQGGFSLRVEAEFLAALPATAVVHDVTFRNDNFQGRFGWHEIVIDAPPEVHVFDTNAFSTSLTGALKEALRALPTGGALDERTAHLRYSLTAPPLGAVPLGPRAAANSAPASIASAASTQNVWLETKTRALVTMISAPHLPWTVTLWAVLAAALLGAVHAFSPGHGKTIVGAYLVGSRGTPRHAAFLGLTVTITHTIGVFALGAVALLASRYVMPERLFPILSLLSGLIVLAMGIVLLAQRWKAFRRSSDPHSHAHDHTHAHAHAHAHGDEGMHSHGGRMHSHLPAGNASQVSWRSLLALGISGGLIPCPSALVLLLAAIALNKTAYGILLVVSFSLGLSITLTGVGLAFLYAGSRLRRHPSSPSWWLQAMPVVSAAAITVVGAILCLGALQSAPV